MTATESPVFRFCKKCNCETERHKHGHCKPCTNARSSAWKKNNPEKVKAARDAWLEANPGRIEDARAAWLASNRELEREKNKARKRANPERERQNYAAWVARNPGKGKERSAAWRLANPERESRNHKAWRAANPEAIKRHNQNRRALKIGSGGELSKGIAEKLFALQKGKCACCGEPLGNNYHLDHIMPLALGGTNTDDNIQLLRQRCNNQKHKKHPIDFMQERGFLL